MQFTQWRTWGGDKEVDKREAKVVGISRQHGRMEGAGSMVDIKLTGRGKMRKTV